MQRFFLRWLALFLLLAPPVLAAPQKEIHSLQFFIHVDMIDAGAGRDLAWYQQLIETRAGQANVLLQGHQGPADAGCCVELDPIAVATFGAPGDGLDVISNAAEMSILENMAPGSFIVQTLQYCAGTIGSGIRGCASQPGDFFVVALDAEDTGFLSNVIAHERGHNSGLGHTSSNPCELMQASNGGGCISVSSCNAFRNKGDTTAGTCDCLADTVGDPPASIGTSCGASDVCSEGVCANVAGLAGAELIAAAGPGASTGVSPDTIASQSPLAGGWRAIGAAGPEISGLAYDAANDVLYGIEVLAGDDALVILDPDTGAVLSTVGALSGRDGVIALAFDPQLSGDRLLAIHVDDDFFGTTCAQIGAGVTPPCVSELFEIDPDDASVTMLGELNQLIIPGGVTGLAWDDATASLYGTTPAGIDEIDLASCNGFVCGNASINNLYRAEGALSFDPVTGRILREGGNGFGLTEIDVVDPATGDHDTTIGIDGFTPGGLAIRAVPEPGSAVALGFGVVVLAGLDRRRRARVSRVC